MPRKECTIKARDQTPRYTPMSDTFSKVEVITGVARRPPWPGSLAGGTAELGRLPAFAPERLATTTRFFQDLVILPLITRAVLGEQLETLRAEIEPHVAQTVTFFSPPAVMASPQSLIARTISFPRTAALGAIEPSCRGRSGACCCPTSGPSIKSRYRGGEPRPKPCRRDASTPKNQNLGISGQ